MKKISILSLTLLVSMALADNEGSYFANNPDKLPCNIATVKYLQSRVDYNTDTQISNKVLKDCTQKLKAQGISVIESTKDKASDLKGGISDKVDQVKDKTEDTKDNVSNKVEDLNDSINSSTIFQNIGYVFGKIVSFLWNAIVNLVSGFMNAL